jgi:hypothetical protein
MPRRRRHCALLATSVLRQEGLVQLERNSLSRPTVLKIEHAIIFPTLATAWYPCALCVGRDSIITNRDRPRIASGVRFREGRDRRQPVRVRIARVPSRSARSQWLLRRVPSASATRLRPTPISWRLGAPQAAHVVVAELRLDREPGQAK